MLMKHISLPLLESTPYPWHLIVYIGFRWFSVLVHLSFESLRWLSALLLPDFGHPKNLTRRRCDEVTPLRTRGLFSGAATNLNTDPASECTECKKKEDTGPKPQVQSLARFLTSSEGSFFDLGFKFVISQ